MECSTTILLLRLRLIHIIHIIPSVRVAYTNSIYMALDRTIDGLRDQVCAELFQNVMPFWTTHSHDDSEGGGGFFSCLDQDGSVYDDHKYLWLNGRQIWMYGKLCNLYDEASLRELSGGKLSRALLLSQARTAADYMLLHAFRDDGMVYFALTQDGLPSHFQRKMFSACFLCLGMAALSADPTSPRREEYRTSAVSLLHSIIQLSHDPSPLGRTPLPGSPAVSPLNVPMILLNVIDELRELSVLPTETEQFDYRQEEKWCVEEILKHVIVEKRIVLESVLADGREMPGYDGRLMNPGHAIEAGWFLLSYGIRMKDKELIDISKNMIEWSFEAGWDKEHGGLFYFLDCEGKSTPYLEWSMKLWWPHTEALIAYAMLYELTGNAQHWDRLCLIYNYTVTHFSDKDGGGEWFGYLDRQGNRTHRFKGGPYKGCFHVPRSLEKVYSILRRLSTSDALK